MNWKEKLTGLRWEHKDAEVRRRAVAEMDDPRLIQALPRLAAGDPDAGVRIQALERLDEEAWWLECSETDSDAQVRTRADQRLPHFFHRPAANETYLKQRVAWLERGRSTDLLYHLAVKAADTELRTAAITRIEAQGFLGDRVIGESDPEIARRALKRITQTSTLERIAGKLRKSNKERVRWVQARLAELNAQSDVPAASPRFATLCKEMEQLSRGEATGGGLADRCEELVNEWQHTPGDAGPALTRRFEAASAIVRAALQRPSKTSTASTETTRRLRALLEASDAGAARAEVESLEKTMAPEQRETVSDLIEQVQKHIAALDTHPHAVLQSLHKRIRAYQRDAGQRPDPARVREFTSDWDRHWNRIDTPTAADEQIKHTTLGMLAALREQAESRRERQARDLSHVTADLGTIEKALDEGNLAGAQQAIHAARADFNRMSRREQQRHGELNAQINQLFGRLKEMRDWQRWSNDKIRKQLIEEVDALPQQKLHPDAVAAKLKEARESWQHLEAQEILPGDKKKHASSPGMWRKFQAACKQAFADAKPYFEKRESLQQDKFVALEAFISDAGRQAEAESPDFRQLEKLLRQARRQIRRLDDIPPAARRGAAQSLRELMDKITGRLNARWDEVEKVKQKLIHEARQLEHEHDADKAMAEAKSLQRRWQEAGATRRRREQALWNAFREPIDPIFSKVKEKRAEQDAKVQEARAEIEALCGEAEKLAACSDAELAAAGGRMAGLSQQWQSMKVHDRRLRQRFSDAEQTVERRLLEQEQKEAQAVRAGGEKRAELLQAAWDAYTAGTLDADTRKKLDESWPETPDDAGAKTLRQRFDACLSGETESLAADTGGFAETARAMLIEMEFLAGRPSPEEEREARMAYQVKRLSDQLAGGGERRGLAEEVADLLNRWQLCFPLPPDQAPALLARYRATVKLLDEMITNA